LYEISHFHDDDDDVLFQDWLSEEKMKAKKEKKKNRAERMGL